MGLQRMISMDKETDSLYLEAQMLAKKDGTNLSKEICRFIRTYHETMNRPVKVMETYTVESFNLLDKWSKEDLGHLKQNDLTRLRIALMDRQRNIMQVFGKDHPKHITNPKPRFDIRRAEE